MTGREMQIYFVRHFESIGISTGVISDDVFRFINAAQEDVFLSYVNRPSATRGEVEALKPFQVVGYSISTTYAGTTYDLGSFSADAVTFPLDFLFFSGYKSKVKINLSGITYTLTNNKRVADNAITTTTVRGRIAQLDDIYKLMEDPFSRTKSRDTLAIIEKSGMVIYTDTTFLVDSVLLDYIRKPAKVSLSVDSELPDFLHQDVVDRAISIYLELSNNQQNTQ